MSLGKEQKEKVIQDFRLNAQDTGSIEVQVALLTERINTLKKHMDTFKKDVSSKAGLLNLIGRRRKLLKYLEDAKATNYKDVIKRLGLKK